MASRCCDGTQDFGDSSSSSLEDERAAGSGLYKEHGSKTAAAVELEGGRGDKVAIEGCKDQIWDRRGLCGSEGDGWVDRW
ncbi:hypothetical protein M0R45_009064 [Rubus argutus]|uniref:Uncharacterized protein n=1 Tax=Rubus argutus TaxID=59490 RepID=A0AAW1Y6X4_RUBAR